MTLLGHSPWGLLGLLVRRAVALSLPAAVVVTGVWLLRVTREGVGLEAYTLALALYGVVVMVVGVGPAVLRVLSPPADGTGGESSGSGIVVRRVVDATVGYGMLMVAVVVHLYVLGAAS